ncbi:MAG: hypothetical protein HQL68_04445 [Magnetococcales bacterium]|nr:hypothetical protein [Magnetococcales bacterium]
MKTKLATNLAADQSMTLSGPGVVKINAAKTVTVSKVAGGGHLGSAGALKAGTMLHTLAPLFGFVLLSAGAVLLVKMWIEKVDRGECQ